LDNCVLIKKRRENPMSTENSDNTDSRYKSLEGYLTSINWDELNALVVNNYVKSGIGELQVPVDTMIRINFLQSRYDLNATEVEIALSRIDVLRTFALIDEKKDVFPTEKLIEEFSLLIENKNLKEKIETIYNA